MTTVIIGNGIIGLTIAYKLALKSKTSDKIILLGKKSRIGSATLAAGAMLNSFCEIEEGSLKTDIDLFRFEISHRATRLWHDFVINYMEVCGNALPEGCADCQGSKGACFELGTYLINNASADGLDDLNYEAVIQALKDFNEPFWEVDTKTIPGYYPESRNRALRGIYLPNEGYLNPVLTVEALDATLTALRNVQVIDQNVEKIISSNGKVDKVVLEDGRVLEADQFVLCSGANVSDIVKKNNLPMSIPKIFYGTGVSLLVTAPDNPLTKVIRTPNRGLACGLYAVPYYTSPKVPLNQFVVGASNFISPWPESQPRVISIQSLLKSLMEQINTNFYKATVERVNLGWRPTTADGYPVIGQTDLQNLYVVTGTKRDGFHLSPLISDVLVSMLKGESVDERWMFFSPKRKLIKNVTREEAIKKAVKHLVSAQFQHDFKPSHGKMLENLTAAYKDDLERLHDKIGAFDWGIPVDMIEMYRYGHISKDD